LTFYGTGFGNASGSNVRCSLNGFPLTVQYAGPQGAPGVDQINVQLPGLEGEFWDYVDGVRPPFELVFSIDGILANRVLLPLSFEQ
jgi:hypothetical protein